MPTDSPIAPVSPISRETREDLDNLVHVALRGRIESPEATVSIWYGGIDGAAAYSRDSHIPHYAASTMKLPLLVAAYRRHERGELDLDAAVDVHNCFASAADGSSFSLEQDNDQDDGTWAALGSTATLRHLAHHSIVKSGNLATNLLLEHVGAGEVATVLTDAGCSGETVLLRGIEDAVARESGLDNLVTAGDLVLVMAGVASRSLAEGPTCERIEAVLAQQEHRDKIPAGLPRGTYVANKTGWVKGVAHDVALVRPVGRPPYVLVVCTTLDVPEQVANELIAAISRRVWEGHVG